MKDKNVIHRDLKTQNILLTKEKNIKIIDFGLAKILTSMSKMASSLVGTPTTIAPEIYEGKNYTFSADIWSLGCIFYELWTGISPFKSYSEEETKQNALECNYKHLPESTLDEI